VLSADTDGVCIPRCLPTSPLRSSLRATPDGIVKRHYAGAFGELAGHARAGIAIDLGQQIERDNRSVAQVAFEKVFGPKAEALAEAVFANFRFGMTPEFSVHLDPAEAMLRSPQRRKPAGGIRQARKRLPFRLRT